MVTYVMHLGFTTYWNLYIFSSDLVSQVHMHYFQDVSLKWLIFIKYFRSIIN